MSVVMRVSFVVAVLLVVFGMNVAGQQYKLPIKVVLVPGCCDSSAPTSFGLGSTAFTLKSLRDHENNPIFDVMDGPWSDPEPARYKYWWPTLSAALSGTNGNAIIAGSSTGSEAVLRAMEAFPLIAGFILSGTDAPCAAIGGVNPEELWASWYPQQPNGQPDKPWQWDAMLKNTKTIYQIASPNDPNINWGNMLNIHNTLSAKAAANGNPNQKVLISYSNEPSATAHLGDAMEVPYIIINTLAKIVPNFPSTLYVNAGTFAGYIPPTSPPAADLTWGAQSQVATNLWTYPVQTCDRVIFNTPTILGTAYPAGCPVPATRGDNNQAVVCPTPNPPPAQPANWPADGSPFPAPGSAPNPSAGFRAVTNPVKVAAQEKKHARKQKPLQAA